MKIIWLILLIACLWIEISTVTLVSIWFSLGAVAALIVEWTGGGAGFQIFAFVVVSAVFLLLLRPISKRYLTPKLTKTNIDAVIGSTGMVTKEINNDLSLGQVKLGGMEWTARSATGEGIPEGTKIRVDKIEGVKVYVTPCPAEVTSK